MIPISMLLLFRTGKRGNAAPASQLQSERMLHRVIGLQVSHDRQSSIAASHVVEFQPFANHWLNPYAL